MAWTQEDLSKLEAALKLGALRVKYRDREMTYRSLDEMNQLLNQAKKELGLIAPVTRRVAQISKGM